VSLPSSWRRSRAWADLPSSVSLNSVAPSVVKEVEVPMTNGDLSSKTPSKMMPETKPGAARPPGAVENPMARGRHRGAGPSSIVFG
jgi:hypothetical protein